MCEFISFLLFRGFPLYFFLPSLSSVSASVSSLSLIYFCLHHLQFSALSLCLYFFHSIWFSLPLTLSLQEEAKQTLNQFFLSQLWSKSTKHKEWVLIFGLWIEINWIRRSSFTDSVKLNRADCKWEMFDHKGVYSADGTSLLLFLWWAYVRVMYSHMQWAQDLHDQNNSHKSR